MTEDFHDKFLEHLKNISYVQGLKPISVTFTILYSKSGGQARDITIVKYGNFEKQIELLIQSPKEAVLEKVDVSKLKSINIGKKKFYTDYDPKISFYNRDKRDVYTVFNEKTLSITCDNKNDTNLIKPEKTVEFESDIPGYVEKLKVIKDFDMCFAQTSKEFNQDFSHLVFNNMEQKTEISLDIYRDEKEKIEELIDRIENKKKVNKQFTKGKIGDEFIIFSKLDENRLVVFHLHKGKEESVQDFAKEVVSKI